MKKDKVIKELSLLLSLVIIICLTSGQAVFAAETVLSAENNFVSDTSGTVSGTDQSGLSQPDSNPSGTDTGNVSEQPIQNNPAADDLEGNNSGSDMNIPAVVYESPILQTDSIHLVAGGDTYELQLENAVNASYELTALDSNRPVTLLNETAQSVTISPVAAGHAVLTVKAVGRDQNISVLTCQITVSELSISSDLVEIYLNDDEHSTNVAVLGADLDAVYYGSGDEWEESMKDAMADSVRCSIGVGNDAVAGAYFDHGTIRIQGFSKGITNVRVHLYGVDFSIKVKVCHYTLNKYTINTYLGSAKKTLKVKGTGSHKVTWVSGNKKVATVSGKGIVTIKGIGATKITAKVNGRKVVCIVSVSSKTACRVVKNARAISKQKNIQYSQAQRMSKNFYDCSSLVYRCYRVYGIRFGYTHPTWAPTAAEEGRWCANTKHLVASGPVDILNCKMVAGDTIYYSFNGNNGRYLNIDHTAIFAGYSYDEQNGYYGTVIEASSSSNTVVERMYYAGSSIQLIGRPSKK